jgi:hypothetical protein
LQIPQPYAEHTVQSEVRVKDLYSNCKALLVWLMVLAAVVAAAATDLTDQLTVTPATIDFGTVPVGSSQTQTVVFTNSGLGKLSIWQVTISGTGFQMSGLSFPIVLQSNQSVSFQVTFTPQASGLADGALSVTTLVSDSPTGGRTYAYVTVPLAGTPSSLGQLKVAPASLKFGAVVDGTSSSLPTTLTAAGSSVTVSAATISNSQFSLSGISLPVTIAAGKSVAFNAVFTPQIVAIDSGTVSFISTAANSPTVLSLTGVGASAPVYSVSLSWDPSTSVAAGYPLVGYNVYRGTISGGPYAKINSTVDPNTVYTDNSVQDGQTYYYVTTAVAADGQESAYSNQTRAVIPKP